MKLPNLNIDLTGEHAWVHVGNQTVSLEALAALSPSMLNVLEQLAKPEANGSVFRVERHGDQVRLVKVGLMKHAIHRARQL